MTKDVRIAKIEVWPGIDTFTGKAVILNCIRVTLSNGERSPLFDSEGKTSEYKALELNKDVRRLKVG